MLRKVKTYTIIFFLIFILEGCWWKYCPNPTNKPKNSNTELYEQRIDSLNKTQEWVEMSNGLYRNKKGEWAIKTTRATGKYFVTDYIKYIWLESGENSTLISKYIDTISFKYIGSKFYKDKKKVYRLFDMADGGNFSEVKGADVETFEVLVGGCYAKDKNGYFWWAHKKTKNEMQNDKESRKVMKMLVK